MISRKSHHCCWSRDVPSDLSVRPIGLRRPEDTPHQQLAQKISGSKQKADPLESFEQRDRWHVLQMAWPIHCVSIR